MSEYQYYEFRAIDRPLTEEEMDELGALSSRAEITPTSFKNAERPAWLTSAVTRRISIGPPTGGGPG